MVQYRSLHRLRYMTGQLSMNDSAPPGEDHFAPSAAKNTKPMTTFSILYIEA